MNAGEYQRYRFGPLERRGLIGSLRPVQVIVIPANPKALDYANDTGRMLREAGVRAEVDLRDDKLGAKIRDAELQKIPYMLVVGPREAEAGTVAPRRKGAGQLEPMTRQAFVDRVLEETRSRTRD